MKEHMNQNYFGYWFPKIKDCGIKVPKTLIFEVPREYETHFFSEEPDTDFRAVERWINKNVIPVLKKSELNGKLLFIKNGLFSNKFDATDCFTSVRRLADSLMNINYAALCLGAGGWEELVIRERIPHNMKKTPCIYGGLPLRSEFRVFYNFDTHKVLYTTNYWQYDYVCNKLYDITDKVIFEYMRKKLEAEFEKNEKKVSSLVHLAMKRINELKGNWSIDIMMDENGNFWLIDMAIAEESAYWKG